MAIFSFFMSLEGEDREKAPKEALEALKILEEQGLGDKKFFGGETINMVDIALAWLAYWFECFEDIVGLKLVEPNTMPKLHTWLQNLKQVPVIKENLPDYQNLITYVTNVRHKFLSKPT